MLEDEARVRAGRHPDSARLPQHVEGGERPDRKWPAMLGVLELPSAAAA